MTAQWLTIAQAADLMQLSRSKLYGLMDAGELKYLRVGRCRRITADAIAEFQQSIEQGGWARAASGVNQ